MLELVKKDKHAHKSTLDEILRQGAIKLLKMSLQAEVDEYIQENFEVKDSNGHRMVVRNGSSQKRKVLTGAGVIEVSTPRVSDKREDFKFTSKILPPYMRKTPNVENLLPILYLKGISSNQFEEALTSILGEGVRGLSSSSIISLKKAWSKEFDQWSLRPITKKYVYLWADGVNVKLRLGDDDRLCLLVVIGVTSEGKKELLAVEAGYKESAESWKCLFRSLIDRGFTSPSLIVADGALGLWKAIKDLGEFFKETKEQSCWVHRIGNVLDALPKSLQVPGKSLLHEMMNAASKEEANKAKKRFDENFKDKYPKAVKKLDKTWEKVTTFFDFPSNHWVHMRSTNVIESTFASVKSRTRSTKGAGSPQMASAMTFKLLESAEKRWRKIRSPEKLQWVIKKLDIKDGELIDKKSHNQEVA